MKKRTIALLFVFIATVFIGGSFALLETKNPISISKNSPATLVVSSPTAISCRKIPLNQNLYIYDCFLYSLKLPGGWMEDGKEYAEFTNYNANDAPGRSYDAQLDKGKKKFAITIFRTSADLRTIALKHAATLGEKTLSIIPLHINNYSAVKITCQDTSGHDIDTIYIQNTSRTLIAEIDPTFGFPNSLDFKDNILSTFLFLK